MGCLSSFSSPSLTLMVIDGLPLLSLMVGPVAGNAGNIVLVKKAWKNCIVLM